MRAPPHRATVARATFAAVCTAAVAVTICLGASGSGASRAGAAPSGTASASAAASTTAVSTTAPASTARAGQAPNGQAPNGQAPARQAPAAQAGQAVTGPMGGPQLTRPGVVVAYPSRPLPRIPAVPAGAFVVTDATTGQVLAAKNAHVRYGPASTLKILTAISLIPVLNPNATVVASKRAVSVEPDIVGLKQGQRYKVADLFRALLLISGNDAAIALAEATGSFSKGIALMNAEAHHLQAYDTVAKQPNGLDAPGQHVSAYDQALIARQALQTPGFLTYDETLQAWFPITPRHRIELFNQDRLLTEYPGFLGGKTGWTTPAMATYVGIARRHGHVLIVTLLHAIPGTIFNSATALLNWGFQVDGSVRPVGWLVNPLPATPPRAPLRGAHPVAVTHRAAAHPQPAHGGIVVPLTLGSLAFAALALGGYGAARRRRARGSPG